MAEVEEKESEWKEVEGICGELSRMAGKAGQRPVWAGWLSSPAKTCQTRVLLRQK